MKFGTFPLDDAIGAVLAHSARTRDGVLKKGRTLTAPDIAALRAAGVESVIAARLDAGDVTEDAAAARIAAALAGSGTTVAAPFTGRANIFAGVAGLVRFDRAALEALNAIDEGVTVASVAPFERVASGQMIATIKIIPFAVAEIVLQQAEHAAVAASLHVAAFERHCAGLILTTLPQTKASVLAKRRTAIVGRLTSLGSVLEACETVPHRSDTIATAIRTQVAASLSPILVFAASAIVDRADVVPAGLIAAGGEIIRLGMPVDPGNLLLLGRISATPVIGIPSCAGSPKLNGFDWVLERVLTGSLPSGAEIAAMGIGGLLKEIDSRPQPRAGDTQKLAAADAKRRRARITALVLAAGRSTRMGGPFKLTETMRGRPMVRHVVDAARAAQVSDVVVVTGHRAGDVRAALDGLDVAFAHNPDFAEGLSTSLRTGLAALPSDCDGVLVLLGDMPDVTAGEINRLLAAFSPSDLREIVVPVRHGRRGNPVLWSARFFAEMRDLDGDGGARVLLARHDDVIAEIEMASDAVLTDIDTPEALHAARARAAE